MDGTTLSHYSILATLGEGGMGVVHLAEDQVLHRRVALKVLRPESVGDEGRRARFLQEARSAAALNHPHIATIYEANEINGTLFIAMELIEGQNLRSVLREPMPLARALDIATQMADGLAHAHAHRVVHRDLKPENVMVTPSGRVKILDFGLAKVTTSAHDATATMLAAQSTAAGQLTVQGQLMGTPAYMSPEQARGQEVDFRSDVFSFGSTLYEMCTGKPSFFGPSQLDTLSAILHVNPPPLSHVVTGAPPALEDIITRCLAKDPAERYASTDDLVAELRQVDLTAKPRRRRGAIPRRKLAIGAGATAASAAALAAGLWLRPEFGGGTQHPGGATDWILVSDFEGTSQTPGLAEASRELVAAALGQSSIVTPLSRAQVQRGVRMASLPDTTRVTGEVARELAYRASAHTYVDGRVDQIGSRYSIVLNVIDAKTRSTLHTLNGVANTEAEFIDTMENLSHQLREKLGEKRSAVRSTARLREIITPSFDAFQIYVRAIEMHRQRKYKNSNQLLRQALALDPEFASAEKLRALNYSNLGFADSARMSYEAALRSPARLTAEERLDLQFFDAREVRYDLRGALEISAALLKLPHVTTGFLSNRGTVQFNLGRYEDALATQDSGIARSLFGASELLRLNNFKTLMQLGRYDRARAVRDSLTGSNAAIAALEYAVCRTDWQGADSLAARLQHDPSADNRFQAALAVAAMSARRGAITVAAHNLEAMISQAPNRFWADVARIARVQLGICAGTPVPPNAPFLADTTMACTIVRGIAAAAAGDMPAQSPIRQSARNRGGPEKRRYEADLQVMDAWGAASAGNLETELPGLEPAMRSGTGPWFCGRVPLRWLIATAHDRAGRTDAAIRGYELVLSSERLHQDAWMWWPLTQPFAHLRLAALLAKAGRRADAESHARAVLESLTEPDSQGARLVAEAQAVLAGAPPQP